MNFEWKIFFNIIINVIRGFIIGFIGLAITTSIVMLFLEAGIWLYIPLTLVFIITVILSNRVNRNVDKGSIRIKPSKINNYINTIKGLTPRTSHSMEVDGVYILTKKLAKPPGSLKTGNSLGINHKYCTRFNYRYMGEDYTLTMYSKDVEGVENNLVSSIVLVKNMPHKK